LFGGGWIEERKKKTMARTDTSSENGTAATLLVVDDCADNRFAICELVDAYLPECRVLTASSAQDGLEMATEHPFDGMLINAQMSGMDGIEMCRRLKGDERTAHAPIILLTAHRTTSMLRAEGLDAGAEDFIAQPVDNVELAARIRVILRNKQTADGLRRLVAERKRMEEMLLQSSRLIVLGQMAAGMAHELNQPLTGISVIAQGYRMLIERGVQITPEGLLEDSELILEQVERMRRLIEHLRIFSRDRSAEPKEETFLGGVINSTLQITDAQLKSHGIELHLELAEDLPPVLGDSYRLEQVLLNLINNARDILGKKQEQAKGEDLPDWVKRLHIGARCEGGQVIVEVEDTGSGISAENQQKLFQPFPTMEGPDRGMELGLAICHAIVQDHQGMLECQSEEGRGTLFRIALPQCNSS